MKIQTITPVTYNSGITGSTTSNVVGVITGVNYSIDFTVVTVNYAYYDIDMNLIKANNFVVNGVEALNAQFALVYPILPPADNEYPYTPTKFYEVFKYHMANTFNTTLNNIEIVD